MASAARLCPNTRAVCRTPERRARLLSPPPLLLLLLAVVCAQSALACQQSRPQTRPSTGPPMAARAARAASAARNAPTGEPPRHRLCAARAGPGNMCAEAASPTQRPATCPPVSSAGRVQQRQDPAMWFWHKKAGGQGLCRRVSGRVCGASVFARHCQGRTCVRTCACGLQPAKTDAVTRRVWGACTCHV